MSGMKPEVVYHARHYFHGLTRDVIHLDLPKAKEWVEYRASEDKSVEWQERPAGCWKAFSSEGSQIGEIHRRRIGNEFDWF